MKKSLAFVSIMVLVAGTASGQAAKTLSQQRTTASFNQPPHGPKFRAGTVLVRFRGGTASQKIQAAHAAARAQVVRAYRSVPGLQRVQLGKGQRLLQALRSYRGNPSVLYAEPDYRVHVLAGPVIPNDPQFAQQWDMNNTGQSGGTADADVDAPEAWSITTGSKNVAVGVIDTGVDYTHPELADNVWTAPFDFSVNGVNCAAGSRGFNAAYGTCDPFDDNNHGTHVSGTIGAKGNNGDGVAGLNWNVTIVPCKFLDSFGSGFTSDAITCLDFLKDLKDNHAINVVATNNSWGGDGFSQALQDAISAQMQSGILFIAAAGNAASDNDFGGFYPADYFLPNMLAVASTDRNDALSFFSNWGKRTVQLGAPGEAILSTTPNNTYSVFDGTSMAAPHVTGAAALLAAQDPSRDWRAIKNLLLAGGDDEPSLSNTITGKRLNANGSMSCTNKPVMARLQPTTDSPGVGAGFPITFAVLNINCAIPNGEVTATIDPGGTTLTLKDDGSGPDQAAGDGLYTAAFTFANPGQYTVSIAGGETFTVTALYPYYFQPVASNYRTIAGTNLNFVDDDVAQVTPSFPIHFGGATFQSLWVSSNGTISLDTAFESSFNTQLPAAGTNTLVAPWWIDLVEPSASQNVFWQELGTAPDRELVVEWRDVSLFCSYSDDWGCYNIPEQSVRFQVVFSESSDNVLFNYADAVFGADSSWADYGAWATVGVQIGSTSANTFSDLQPSLDDNAALLWTTTAPNINNPVPALTSIQPSSVIRGSPDFTLTVNGSGFVDGSVLRWNGYDRPTTYVSGSQLQASIPAADIGVTDTSASVAVFNFTAGLSNALPLAITGPVIDSLSPASIVAGSSDFTLTVNGTGFESGAVVRWGGSARPTTFVNDGQVTAAISAADVASVGTTTVTIVNPDGGTSSSSFSVEDFSVSLSPASASVSRGTTTTFTAAFQGLPSSFDGEVTLSCSVSAPIGRCSAAQSTAYIGAGNNLAVIFNASPSAAARPEPASPWRETVLACLLGLPLGLTLLGRTHKGRKKAWFLAATVLLLGIATTCGGSKHSTQASPSSTQTATITLSAASGNLQHKATATITVH